jgi:N-formylglutamate amidohydrolase
MPAADGHRAICALPPALECDAMRLTLAERPAGPSFMLFELRASARGRPVLLSSPHSGRLYPDRLLAALRVDRAVLRPLDDGPVDVLLEPALEQAAGLLVSLLPRAWIDLNRAPDEIDAAEVRGAFKAASPHSPKVRAGLGLVPTRVGGQALYPARLRAEDLEERLNSAYWPFHRALAAELEALRALHGVAVLLDCHSMPRASVAHQAGQVDVVVGDRHGRAAAPPITAAVVRELRGRGLTVAANRPFAGGFITESHGRPDDGVHAIQIEVRRDLFLDEADYRLHRGIGPLGQTLAAVVAAVSAEALRRVGRPVAA